MSDNLHDRIAAVLADEFKRQAGYACEWAVLADAVICELDLQPIQRTTMFPERRWVTPWELIDDE